MSTRRSPAGSPRRFPPGTLPAVMPVVAVPAGMPAGPALPTWRSALDTLWASIADDGEGRAVAPGRGGLLGSNRSSRSVQPGGQRDTAEQARIIALVELSQSGDREAFAQLYDVYVDTVFRYVLVRVGNRSLAEDLTSETFLRAMRRIDSFTWQGKDIAAWFVTIARNLIADHVKSARFRFEVTTADMRDADERVDAPEEEVLARLRDERLVAAIKELRPEQAECITLRFLQGLSLADTATVLGRSEGAVKQLQLRATRALRAALDGAEL